MCPKLGMGGGCGLQFDQMKPVLETHHSLKVANEEALKYLSCFITVSYIFEGFGCVLTTYV